MAPTTLPGLNRISSILKAYSSAWQQNLDALNGAWTIVTSEGLTLEKLPGAWSKVIQSAAEGALEVWDACIGAFTPGAAGNTPVITLTVKPDGTTVDSPVLLPLPIGVSAANVLSKAPQLIGTANGAVVPPDLVTVENDGGGQIKVSVKAVAGTTQGTYVAFLYIEPSANSPLPSAFATVLIVVL